MQATPLDRMTIHGRTLRAARRATGLTIREILASLNTEHRHVTPQMLLRHELGRQSMSPHIVRDLCRLYDLTPAQTMMVLAGYGHVHPDLQRKLVSDGVYQLLACDAIGVALDTNGSVR